MVPWWKYVQLHYACSDTGSLHMYVTTGKELRVHCQCQDSKQPCSDYYVIIFQHPCFDYNSDPARTSFAAMQPGTENHKLLQSPSHPPTGQCCQKAKAVNIICPPFSFQEPTASICLGQMWRAELSLCPAGAGLAKVIAHLPLMPPWPSHQGKTARQQIPS